VYIHFWGILPGAKFTLRPSLAFSYIVCVTAVTAQHSRSARKPNFAAWYQEWNYGTFAPRLSTEGATYIPRAAITLGIGHILVMIIFIVCYPAEK